MSKRTWSEAELASPHSVHGPQFGRTSSTSPTSPVLSTSPKKARIADEELSSLTKTPSKHGRANSTVNGASADSKLPGISRKVKACAACRKQKVDQTEEWRV
jgi:hypothetical protein